MKNIITFLVILGVSLLPFIWTPKGYFINGEVPMFMNYETLLEQASYSWTNYFSQGEPASPTDTSLIIPEATLYKILTSAGISNDIVQKIYISLSIMAIATAFYLCSRIFSNSNSVFLAGFCLYFFNFYTKSTISYTAKVHQLILLPLLFFVTYRYFETKKALYLATNVVAIFLFQSIFTNLPQALTTFLVYPLAAIFYIYRFGIKSIRLKNVVLFFAVIAPTILYQMLIWYFSLYQNLETSKVSATFKSLSSPINRLFQLRGSWWEDIEFYNPLLQHYNNFIIITLSFTIIFFLIYLNTRQKESGVIKNFWLICFLFFLALSSGTSFMPGIYEFFYEKLPLFYIFREPWAKFIALMIFCLSILAVIGLQTLAKIKNKSHYYLILIAFFGLLFTVNYPFFTRNFFGQNIKNRLTFSKPPDYWWEYKKWTAYSNTPSILPLPFAEKQITNPYRWYPDFLGNTSTNMPLVFGSANIYTNYDGYKPSTYYTEYIKQKDFSFIKIAGLDYIMIQKDLDIDTENKVYGWQYNSFKDYVNPEPAVIFGNKLLLYSIKDEYRLNRFYIPNHIYYYNNNGFVQQTQSSTFKSGDAWMQNAYKENGIIRTGSINRIVKINPTKYRVDIETKTSETPLIFTQQYNKSWKIYCASTNKIVGGKFFETWFKKPIVEESVHFPVNSYQNYWKITPESACKQGCCERDKQGNLKLDLVIEYWPQRLFYIGAGISVTTLVICVSYLIYSTVHERRKKNVVRL